MESDPLDLNLTYGIMCEHENSVRQLNKHLEEDVNDAFG